MIMSEFPLQIKTKAKWNALQKELEQEKKLEATLITLEPADVGHGFIGRLLPFQKLGLDFLLKTNGIALLADEMGLGKTVQALSFISRIDAPHQPTIVVAPLVTLENWYREIIRFLQVDMTTGLGALQGVKPRVQKIRSGKTKLKPAEFYLINYEMLSRHVNALQSIKPGTIIFDECQNLRNNTTAKYEACTALGFHETVKHRIGLSGTPIHNRGIEMYNIASAIKPGLLGDRQEFIRRYCMEWDSSKTESGKRDALSARLKRSILLRRRKTDVLPDLPSKNKIQQTIPIDTTLYKTELAKMYQKIRDAQRDLTDGGQPTDDNKKKEGLFELNKIIREMRVAERQIAGLSKVPHVVKYINGLLTDYEDEKFVVFCHHRSVHQTLLDGLFMYNPVQVIGGQSDKERQAAIDRFQTGRARVMICGLRAGGVGINLTEAAYVIFAELDWSPSIHRQAEDRLHRIGQKNTVFSHYLVGEGTFDEHIVPRLMDKTVEIADILGDKLETIDNAKTLQLLEDKFGVNEHIQEITVDD